LRQQHLEALGWRFHRIWSTDWFVNPGRETDRAEEAFKQAVAASDRKQAELGPSGESISSSTGSNNLGRLPNGTSDQRRPDIPRRSSITDYSLRELDAIVHWVAASSLKTDDEIVAEVVRELGFERRGRKIDTAIRQAIARVRSTNPEGSATV
jgi:hypothetical protein